MNELATHLQRIVLENQNTVHAEQGVTPEWGVMVLDAGRPQVDIKSDSPFVAASINKLPIAQAVAMRRVQPQTELVLEEDDVRDGNGILRHFPRGYRLEVGDLLSLSLGISDNTAAAMLVRAVGGANQANDTLATDPKLIHTRLQPDIGNDNHFTYGVTTPAESAYLHRMLMYRPIERDAMAHGDFVAGARSKLEQHPEAFAFPRPGLLRIAKILHRAPGNLKLPDSAYAALVRAQLTQTPKGEFPNKEGTVDDIRHETIQIGHLTVAALSRGHQGENGLQLARRTLAKIGSAVLNFGQP